MKDCKVNILGAEYAIQITELKDEDLDGDCDSTSKTIRIRSDNTCNVLGFEELQRVALRHEIIHAFMFESGLGFSWEHPGKFGHDETTVDWFARQFPKILKIYQELDIL